MSDSSIVAGGPLGVNADVLSRDVEGDLVLYHPRTDAITHLDPVAACIWRELASEPTFDDLVAALVERFHADPAAVRHDTLALLEALAAADLLA